MDSAGQKVMTPCLHPEAEVTAGPVYLACACGAVKRRFDPDDTWHVCELCARPSVRKGRTP